MDEEEQQQLRMLSQNIEKGIQREPSRRQFHEDESLRRLLSLDPKKGHCPMNRQFSASNARLQLNQIGVSRELHEGVDSGLETNAPLLSRPHTTTNAKSSRRQYEGKPMSIGEFKEFVDFVKKAGPPGFKKS